MAGLGPGVPISVCVGDAHTQGEADVESEVHRRLYRRQQPQPPSRAWTDKAFFFWEEYSSLTSFRLVTLVTVGRGQLLLVSLLFKFPADGVASSRHPAPQQLAVRRCGRERAGWAAAGGCRERGGTGVRSGSRAGSSPRQDIQTPGSSEAPGPRAGRRSAPSPLPTAHPSRTALLGSSHSVVWGKDHSEGRTAPVAGAQPGAGEGRGAAAPLSSAGPRVALVQSPVPWFCALRSSSTGPPFLLQQIDNRLWWGYLRQDLRGGAAGNEHQREVKCVSVRRWAVGTRQQPVQRPWHRSRKASWPGVVG